MPGDARDDAVDDPRVAELHRLRAALAAAEREIVQLRRALALVRGENERLRIERAGGPGGADVRVHQVRTMLLDRHSRNP